MAKRGRKPLPYDPPSWRPIYQEVWDLNVRDGWQFIAACREVGRRRSMDWQVVRKRVLRMQEHGEAVKRIGERINRGIKKNDC